MTDGWDPATYGDVVATIPGYERLQEELVAATLDREPSTILELGTGTGETAQRLLDAHPRARLVGLDSSPAMLDAARSRLADRGVDLRLGLLEAELPEGPFELVVSALAVHHLNGRGKARLFRRVAERLAPAGRFALGDVVVPRDPRDAAVELEAGCDLPSRVDDQLRWLREAGLTASARWEQADLAVLVADRSA
jgi:tRNA (cmo5U34)-methyltransferase